MPRHGRILVMEELVAFEVRDSDIDHIVIVVNHDHTLVYILLLLFLQLKSACKVDIVLAELGLNRDQVALLTLHSTIGCQLVTCLDVHLKSFESSTVPGEVFSFPAGDQAARVVMVQKDFILLLIEAATQYRLREVKKTGLGLEAGSG